MLDWPRLSKMRAFRRLTKTEERVQEPEGPLPARVICIASGKGGTGKSVLATNLAALRAQRGERVLLIDFDAGMANAHLLLGLSPPYDLGHVVDGKASVAQATVRGHCGVNGSTVSYDLISGGVGREALANPTRRELDRLFRALEALEGRYDLILIDHGAGIGVGTIAHLAATSTLLLVTGHEVTALSDGYALYKRAVHVNPDLRVGLVVNRVRDEAVAQSAWQRFETVSCRFLDRAPEFIGWVPTDDAVARSVEKRRPVSLLEPDSPAAQALSRVAAWEPLDLARTATAFWERARRSLR